MPGKPGMAKQRAMGPDDARNRMWQCMRRLRQFTAADVEAVAEASRDNVRKYLRALARAGYLAQLKPASGQPGGHAVWHLARNTGPIAPRAAKGGVYDANLEPIPKPRPEDKPLCRHAPALLRQLRVMVDLIERADAPRRGFLVDDDAWQAALAESRTLILKAEGRA